MRNKKHLLLGIMLISLPLMAQRRDYPIQEVPFSKVTIDDQFWLPRIDTNRTVTIPSSFKKCEETGRVENFILAGKKNADPSFKGKFQTQYPFDDTDIYKIIEGAAYSLTVHPDPKLEKYVDSLITIIGKAQEPDGYLYTARTIDPEHPHPWSGAQRWVNESILSHETYDSGHLFEAAAAWYQATGQRNFLDIALKNADLLCRVFGPGKRHDATGHEIVEMGLVRLYRITGEKKYLNLAKFFIDCRGRYNNPRSTYSQDDKPVVDQTVAEGHAVRAGYLYSGVADVAALTGDTAYRHAIDKIWNNMVSKKYYITGGIGAIPKWEGFGDNYQLPNLTAYNETCASIANVFWNYRMFLLHGDAKYIDVLERTLYNSLRAGVSISGDKFFYANPLACDGKFQFNRESLTRQPWFDCSCCPTNMCRFMPSLPKYIYAQNRDSLYINLFVGSKTDVTLNGRMPVKIDQQTNYPWSGNIRIGVHPEHPSRFSVCLRIPGWVQNQPVPSNLYAFKHTDPKTFTIRINGKPVSFIKRKGYAVISRTWGKNDEIAYTLPMPIRRVIANQQVKNDQGKVTLERGPIVYCLEGIDNGGNVSDIILPDATKLKTTFYPDLLGGIDMITGEAKVVKQTNQGVVNQSCLIKAIPYYAWSNRGVDEMEVWIPDHSGENHK
ncbi:glycoside hydrolase family 127 protein [Microbacter margulisiae]|uniref:Glycoside hydrolase family 127 protein n=1 Tax=Microbacter margulisiae TaxID=1350067 RepID=A0A7W5H3B7_9PORP|nr:glycoside hydrolase family 127 protein [Microbacter margulisiae]MBB3188301.1 hypothetical protein [Microbacter margulisiae]